MHASIRRGLTCTIVLAMSLVLTVGSRALAVGDTVDEIHYEYGSAPGSVVLVWHGAATTVDFGPTTAYGQQVTATATPVKPVDTAGPFMRATLTGLAADTTYHYRIGATGADHTLRAAPTGSFTSVDIGDTASTLCAPWMTAQHQLIANQAPAFVTHGGDITYANECGKAAVHRYFQDQAIWSTSAAMQASWGNHEYAAACCGAPTGTPRDSMANYKGRIPLTNPQTLPVDTATLRSNPGCSGPATGNNCRGDDWGWFRAGGVLYISYPEPWLHAYTDWKTAAVSLMATAQADPSIDFIVTFGHRPAYSTLSSGADLDLRSALTALSAAYSPTAAHPDGKFVLTIGHHIHAAEVFEPIGGLTEINNGGGGAGQASFGTPAAHSILRVLHPSVMRSDYDATAHTLTVNILCGTVYTPNPKDPCAYGTSLYTQTFVRPGPPAPTVTVTESDGQTSAAPGTTLTYTTTVHAANAATAGVGLAVTVPAGATLTGADAGATVNGATVSWDIGALAAGASATRAFTVTAPPDTSGGTSLVSTATVTTGDGACARTGSACTASDTDTLSVAGAHEWVTNPGVETNLTGWTGTWGATPTVKVTRDGGAAHTGAYSVLVSAGTGANKESSGYSDAQTTVTSATAGTAYHASVWVRAQAAGQVLHLRLREWNGTTLVTDVVANWTATGTGWHQLTATLTAARTGTKLAFAVYADGLDPGSSFRGDDMSLTS